MDKELLISVVIPVYNVEPYLRKTLDSIIAQGGDDFEVLLVDDGSKDSSGKICDEYAERNDNIHVIHVKNGGVGRARNIGIEHAKGKFLQFIDSDDFLDEGLYDKFRLSLQAYPDIDACYFGLKDYPYETQGEHIPISGLYCNESDKDDGKHSLSDIYLMAKKRYLFFFPTTKFFTREIICRHKLRFREDLHYFEDYLFNLQFFKYVQKVYAIGDAAYYNYVHHPGEHLGGKYSPSHTIVEVAREIFERSELLPMSEELHRMNVLEYYNNLLHAVDSTCNAMAVGEERNTMKYIDTLLNEIDRLGYYSAFKEFLGKRKYMLVFRNRYSVYLIHRIRMLLLYLSNCRN